MAASIRPVALGVAWRGRELLVSEGSDTQTQEVFYRPLGGEIEFGESGADAVVREFQEEIGQVVNASEFLGTLENIFVFEGNRGHELVLVYRVESIESEFYSRDEHLRRDGVKTAVRWRAFDDLVNERIYPRGLLNLIADKASRPDDGLADTPNVQWTSQPMGAQVGLDDKKAVLRALDEPS